MKTWDTLYPWVLPYVLGCPNPTVDRALCDAAREFCTGAAAWFEWSDDVTALGTTQRFDFDVPTNAELVRVRRCTVDDLEYAVRGNTQLPAGWQLGTATKPDKSLIHLDLSEFVVVPMPNAGQILRLELVFKPTINATSFGDDLLNKYGIGIAAGAKASLMLIPGQPWTNGGMASICEAEYRTAMNVAANEAWRHRGPTARHVKKAAL